MRKFILIVICTLCIMTLASEASFKINVLVFTKTTAYYLDATPKAIKAFYEIGREQQSVHDGTLTIENKDHPSTRHFGVDTLKWEDEWYSFDRNPRNQAEVLISIDEKSYNIGENLWFKGINLVMGDHPLVWCHEFDGGRSFQTALGHIPEMYDYELFRKHLVGAVVWAAGENKGE